MALSDCSRQVVWIQALLRELGYKIPIVPICGDNQGSIFIGSNLVQECCLKHVITMYDSSLKKRRLNSSSSKVQKILQTSSPRTLVQLNSLSLGNNLDSSFTCPNFPNLRCWNLSLALSDDAQHFCRRHLLEIYKPQVLGSYLILSSFDLFLPPIRTLQCLTSGM